MTALKHERAVGDTLTEFAIQLTRDGEAIDLSGMDVKFQMIGEDGTVKLAETTTGVTVSDPTNGDVEFDFPGAAVNAAGIYYGFFTIYQSSQSEPETFPSDGVGIQITIFSKTADREAVDPSVDIAELASNPIRVRTVEGTVEERTVNELIKADQYTAAKAAVASDTAPWGIRIARTRPGGTVT